MLTGSWLLDFIVLLTVLTLTLVSYFKWKYTYWRRLGLDNPEPSFPFGNFGDQVKQSKSTGQIMSDIYFQAKAKGLKHTGLYIFHMPGYMPTDPDLIKRIMQTDFHHFVDRGIYYNERDDPLSAHLFFIEGQKWRNLRAKLTPTFTSGKMKLMFPIMVKTCKEMTKVIDEQTSCKEIEVQDLFGRLTTDIIGLCAFGLDCNSLNNPNCEFQQHGKRVFNPTLKEHGKNFLSILFPNIMKRIGMRLIPEDTSKFFLDVIKGTVEYRENNDVKRKDFMQLLIELKNKGKASEEDDDTGKISFEELAAQAFVFFIAGFETSSTTMSFCLFELCLNQTVQHKLREEILSILDKYGDFTYEAIMEMHYMDMVINETLRKYPPFPMLHRMCTKDYKIPNTNITLKKGITVIIPVQGLHSDPDYYSQPKDFNPERFAEEMKTKHHAFTFLPFGEGPRICIGLRFGLMQTKVGLAELLRNYEFKLNQRTQLPIRIDPKKFFNSPVGGIWIDFEKLAQQ